MERTEQTQTFRVVLFYITALLGAYQHMGHMGLLVTSLARCQSVKLQRAEISTTFNNVFF